MKVRKRKNPRSFCCLLLMTAVLFLATSIPRSIYALDASSPVPAAAMKLVEFCDNPNNGLDQNAITTLVDYVLSAKQRKDVFLPKHYDSTGGYHEFDTRVGFARFLRYSYSSQIPFVLTSPSSLRYSLWKNVTGELPAVWKMMSPAAKPFVIHGLQRDVITPDLTTGVYYEYDLRRTLIHFNYEGRQVLVAISKQIDQSGVGKKGVILGDDDDWNYYYSGKPGSAKAGLGWVKSYIYDFFAVGVYVQTGTSGTVVRGGVFQWIRAGWSGINFAQPSHVINGIKRFARNTKAIFESASLPEPGRIISAYRRFSSLPKEDLRDKYVQLHHARESLALESGIIKKTEVKNQMSLVDTSRKQMIDELMLEYFKIALGKSSLLEKKLVMAN
ncbi:MAG TPA: hypothetical protein ENN23_06130 [Deltaproteobacteria bacterium]|nr:hypothetical protein [Deltaproteobacteria bacterium]